MNDIKIEALTLNGDVVAVNVIVSGVPLHYVPKSTSLDLSAQPKIGPCEVWINWAIENDRLTYRAMDESLQAVTS